MEAAMTTMAICWTNGSVDVWDVLGSVKAGQLTTDHAMSSQGLPVVVDADGNALGPAEVGELTCNTYVATDDDAARDIHREMTDDERALVAAARAAGYRVADPVSGEEW